MGDLSALLGQNPYMSPFATALQVSSEVVAVRNDRVNMYGRLWCVFELDLAHQKNKPIRALGIMPAMDPRTARHGVGSSAICSSIADTTKLQAAIRGREAAIDAWVASVMVA